MAKKSMKARYHKRNRLEIKFREPRKILKKQARSAYAKGEIPWETQRKLQALPRNSHPTHIHKICRMCGRDHAFYRKFGLCRACIRLLAMAGKIPGILKASW